MRLSTALAQAASRLAEAGIEDPRREARLLASHLLGVPAASLLDPAHPLDAQAWSRLIARRAAREPLALITGTRGFWTLTLEVSPDTLIPRADSETLIEAALTALPNRAAVATILDLGTGTGCLLLAALSEFPNAVGLGLDIAPAAASLAARNARANRLASRAIFCAADWAAPIAGRFDLILCNPPYIRSADLPTLMPEVRLYEPHRALDGGPSGLDDYARLLPVLPHLLAPGGIAILELGLSQAQPVAALACDAGLTHITTRPDLGGIPRACVLKSSYNTPQGA
jgi:release factor glutamine methyltransferase